MTIQTTNSEATAMSQISPEQAQQQVAAAKVLDCMTRQAARRNAYVGVITTAGVGILVAAVLAISWAFAAHNLLAFWLSFAAYAISLTLLIVWQRATRLARRSR